MGDGHAFVVCSAVEKHSKGNKQHRRKFWCVSSGFPSPFFFLVQTSDIIDRPLGHHQGQGHVTLRIVLQFHFLSLFFFFFKLWYTHIITAQEEGRRAVIFFPNQHWHSRALWEFGTVYQKKRNSSGWSEQLAVKITCRFASSSPKTHTCARLRL